MASYSLFRSYEHDHNQRILYRGAEVIASNLMNEVAGVRWIN